MSDPRYAPGGRLHYGDADDMIAELKRAGVTRNDHGPVSKPDSKRRGRRKALQPLAVLAAMCEKVRQREGFALANWRSAGSRVLKESVFCAICGGIVAAGSRYYTGAGRKAHGRCVQAWKVEVGDGSGARKRASSGE